MTTDTRSQMWAVEENRIRAAYAGRAAADPRHTWARWDHVFLEQDRERRFLRLLGEWGILPLTDKRILEVGSGTGGRLRDLIKWGAEPEHVTGVELLPEAVARARALLPAAVALECRNAADLPYPDKSFDLVLQSTMFSSILDPALKRQVAAEMLRVVKPGGLILWSDLRMDNPWSATVRGVSADELRSLFPHCQFALERSGLAGPLVRAVAGRSWTAASWLALIPWLCTHYFGVIRPVVPARAVRVGSTAPLFTPAPRAA